MPESVFTMPEPVFTWHTFDVLTGAEVYDILRLRAQIFVVEQHCPYEDPDGWDARALHCCGRLPDGALVAYLRMFAPAVKDACCVIGRVVVRDDMRGRGLGQLLMRTALAEASHAWSGVPVRISAQRHLERFYGELGFVPMGEPYDEDGIPHIAMLRTGEAA